MRTDVDNHKGRVMRNEKTGSRVAQIAGRILGAKKTLGGVLIWDGDDWYVVQSKDLRSICASALTQAPPRKPRARRKP